jgi:VCBS repeat-containing protein
MPPQMGVAGQLARLQGGGHGEMGLQMDQPQPAVQARDLGRHRPDRLAVGSFRAEQPVQVALQGDDALA